MLVRSLVLLAIVGLAAADDCGSCLKSNAAAFSGDTSKTANVWCYSTGQCMPLDMSTLTSCPDYAIDASSCLCRPDVYTSCGSCASLSHLGCVWVANASVFNNVSVKLPYVPTQSYASRYLWKTGRCVQGSGFSPYGLQQETSIALPLISLNLTTTVTPTAWYWGQCSLTGPAMSGLLIGAVCGCVACACGLCAVRRRRRKRRVALLSQALLEPQLVVVPVPVGRPLQAPP